LIQFSSTSVKWKSKGLLTLDVESLNHINLIQFEINDGKNVND